VKRRRSVSDPSVCSGVLSSIDAQHVAGRAESLQRWIDAQPAHVAHREVFLEPERLRVDVARKVGGKRLDLEKGADALVANRKQPAIVALDQEALELGELARHVGWRCPYTRQVGAAITETRRLEPEAQVRLEAIAV
jgi:hypothetical protein